ncbi:MAG TPA: hypothetical protein VGX37_09155 [Allosphingosinicella sp.]|nr:hypothetical protein [Allosphingosinicella sp.]
MTVIRTQSRVEVSNSRLGTALEGLAMVGLSVACIAMLVFWNVDSLFLTRWSRQPGIIRAFERAIGWEAFVGLFVILALLFLIAAAVRLWKLIDPAPEVAATPSGLEFHPAVRGPAAYDEVVDWSFDWNDPATSLRIRFAKAYWSLQAVVRRKSVTIYGGRKKLEPLANYLIEQPEMAGKLVSLIGRRPVAGRRD